jgi:hypothetical protein
MLKSPPCDAPKPSRNARGPEDRRDNLFNARPIGSALFNPYWFVVGHQPPSPGLTTPVGRLHDPHALTLIVQGACAPSTGLCVLARTI